MNLFFGKISKKFDINQIEEGYYISPEDSPWFGEMKLGDYAFIIGNDKIQFWQAKEWGDKDGKECLWFDIINNDIGIKLNRFIALNFFKLNKALIVLSSRSARNRAFFPIELTREVDLDFLSSKQTYVNEKLYRKIQIYNSKEQIVEDSSDIQLYYDNDELNIYKTSFIEDVVSNSFRDNKAFLGQGSKMKDKVIKKVSSAKPNPTTTFSCDQLPMRNFYDAYFCDYTVKEKHYLVGAYWDGSSPKDQTDRFVDEGVWENGYDAKFIKDVKAIPEGSHIAIKSVFTKEKVKSVMRIKARGIVEKNLKDGRTLEVNWEEDFKPFDVDFSGGYFSTIAEVTDKKHIDAIWNDNGGEDEEELSVVDASAKFPLNQILYGPPGTGKTYNTVYKAASIIKGSSVVSNYGDAQSIFNENLGGRIEFITFHQSYSYEDFIQGLRPDVEAKGQLSFEKKDGVFTRIATDALFEYYKILKKKNQQSATSTKKSDDNELYLDFVDHLKSRNNKEFKTHSGSKVSITSFTKNDNIEFKHGDSSRTYIVSGKRLLKLHNAFPELDKVKNINNDIRETIGGCNTTVYWVALREYIEFYKTHNTDSDLPDVQDYDEIGYDTKKKLLSTIDLSELRTVAIDEVPKYAIVIDEINRANISRVFGELITLIEPDKRSHGDIPLSCTLPSGESFIVPSNLYIIGTMNTADKSIALLDIALRRRFEFISMYPNYKLKINSVEVLQKINEQIIKLKGYDFQIGHSYFMGTQFNLVDAMNIKVIPLLLEYFMNDEKEVRNIITNAGLKIDENGWPLRITDNVIND